MNPRQVELIQASWTAVEPIADTAAVLFYDNSSSSIRPSVGSSPGPTWRSSARS
jgi:hypothetical protein